MDYGGWTRIISITVRDIENLEEGRAVNDLAPHICGLGGCPLARAGKCCSRVDARCWVEELVAEWSALWLRRAEGGRNRC
jgi:hypothetical protein